MNTLFTQKGPKSAWMNPGAYQEKKKKKFTDIKEGMQNL